MQIDKIWAIRGYYLKRISNIRVPGLSDAIRIKLNPFMTLLFLSHCIRNKLSNPIHWMSPFALWCQTELFFGYLFGKVAACFANSGDLEQMPHLI